MCGLLLIWAPQSTLSTMNTLGTDESGRCKEVAVMGSKGVIWQIVLREYNMFIVLSQAKFMLTVSHDGNPIINNI